MTSTSSIIRRFEGEHVLLTGVTGFLAKSVLERVLRAVPDVAGVHLLVRPRAGADAERRVRDVIASPLFDTLRRIHGDGFEAFVRKRVTVVEGDLSADRLGRSEEAYRALTRRITLVVHCAASCSFSEPLDRALQTNVLGPLRLLELARDAGNVPMVHVSTCYVSAPLPGLVREEPFPAGHSIRSIREGGAPAFDLDAEIRDGLERCARARRAASGGDPERGDRVAAALGTMRARELGWHDVYQYTKALGEQLLARERGGVPLAVVRPSIIESTFEEPAPGWIDGIRMADPIIMAYAKGTLERFAGSVDTVLDLIPCDMVAHAIMAAAPLPGDTTDLPVYQVASGEGNPATLGALTTWAHEALTELAAHSPQVSPPGTPGRWVPETRFRVELRLRRWILSARGALASVFGRRRAAQRARLLLRLVRRVEDLTDLYAFYTNTSPRFATDRTRALFASLSAEDRDRFCFDPTCVDWKDYLQRRHIPGLLRQRRSRPERADDDRHDERRSVPA